MPLPSQMPDHMRRMLPKGDPLYLPPHARPTQPAPDLDDHRPVQDAKPQRHETAALERPAAREKQSVPRITVSFVGYRVRPLDPDNFAGSVKDLLDGLRHAGLIPGDEPWRIRLETEQEKVGSFAEEKTVIEITQP